MKENPYFLARNCLADPQIKAITMPNQYSFDAFHGLNQPALVQDIKAKSEPVAKQATALYRTLRDELNQRDLFCKPQNHAGELTPFSITDKNRRVYSFPFRSNGKRWEVDGPSVMSYLNFIEHIIRTPKGFPAALKDALTSQGKHLAFHKRIIDAHPLIGTSLLLARHISNGISERLQMNSRATTHHSESRNQAIWFERHMDSATTALQAISTTFDKMTQRIHDDLAQAFLNDMRKECEQLILDACNVSFLQFTKYFDEFRAGKMVIPCLIQETSFPISMRDYAAYEDHIMTLRNLYSTYQAEAILSSFPLPKGADIRERGTIQLPVIVSNEDLFHLLSTYTTFWSDFADGLHSERSYPARGGSVRVINALEIGIRTDRDIGQDRFSFRMPGFNIRIDKDRIRKTVALDVGSASLMHVLACLEAFFTTITVQSKPPSIFRNTTALDDASVQLEHKVALLASMLMTQAVPMGLRKNATISHHSREFIGKDEYYTHFSHILASIKEGLEQPVR